MSIAFEFTLGGKTPDLLCASVRVQDPKFAGALAIGVEGEPTPENTAWVVLEVAKGRCLGTHIAILDRTPQAVDVLGAVVAVSGNRQTWSRVSVSGWSGFLDTVSKLGFSVAGDAGFFIRHLVSVVDVLSAVWSDAATAPPQPEGAEVVSTAPAATPEPAATEEGD